MKNCLFLINLILVFQVHHCLAQQKETYGLYINISNRTSYDSLPTCSCGDGVCLPLDSAVISVYLNEKLVKTVYTDTTGSSNRVVLAPGNYLFVINKKGYDLTTFNILLLPGSNFEFSSLEGTPIQYSKATGQNNSIDCCLWLVRSIKSGVRIVPKEN